MALQLPQKVVYKIATHFDKILNTVLIDFVNWINLFLVGMQKYHPKNIFHKNEIFGSYAYFIRSAATIYSKYECPFLKFIGLSL